LKDLEDVAIIEDISLLRFDVKVAGTDVTGAIVVLNEGKSIIWGELRKEDADVSSISLSFSMALLSSESLHGACISYGFSSPRISPK
jgi:hypothetical protein